MATPNTPSSSSFAASSVNSSRVVDLDTNSHIIRIHSRPFNGNGTPKLVHEHLVRERSKALATKIDAAKSKNKDQEMVTINLQASRNDVDRWIKWLYGQPIIACQNDWTDNADKCLESIVAVYTLAYTYYDYECANACLDAIRKALIEKRGILKDPLTLLLTMFQTGRSNKTCDMLVHSLAYGPCVDSGELNRWLDKLKVVRDDVPERWAPFYNRLCKALAARCMAHISGNLDNLPDFMAAHAYHFLRSGEDLCCGRGMPGGTKKRKADFDEPDEEPDEQPYAQFHEEPDDFDPDFFS